MTKLNKKGSLPDYIGGQPPSPRDLAHKGPMHDERQCQYQPTLPPMPRSPAAALRLLPSIALSSQLAWR